MEYNAKNSKRWAIVGQRPTFGLALYEFAKENPNILAVVADVTNRRRQNRRAYGR